MSRLLLDTTFLIDVERSAQEIEEAIDPDDDVAIAAITVAELRVGALLASGRRRRVRMAFVDDVAESIPTISYDTAVAEVHAALLAEVRAQGRPRGAHDLIIAATAAASQRCVVTADASGFEGLSGVEVEPQR